MAGLKVYVDLMSQPSRAILLFLKKNNIAHEKKIVSIAKGEHKKPDYVTTIHPFGQVPAINDNGVTLIESIAILRYLARKYETPNHWYPKEIAQQAKVDEFLEWQHIGARMPLSLFFFTKFLQPIRTGITASESEISKLKSNMETALDNLENIWLKDNQFLIGNEISIADIIGACEVEQPRVAGYEPTEGRPKLSAWMNRVKQELNPHYQEVHVILNKVVERNQAKGGS